MAKKKPALDLISDGPRKAPAKKTALPSKKEAASSSTTPAQEKAKVGGKVLSEAKKEALDIFEEEERKKERKKEKPQEKEDASVFQTIGKASQAAATTQAVAEAEVGETEDGKKILHLKPPIIVKELAEAMDLKPFKVIQDLLEVDVFVNQNQAIEPEVAAQICDKHGFLFEREKREKGAGVHKVEEVIEEPEPEPEPEEDKLSERPPIVTVMGHVDHGKTSLLDALREAKVADGEAGGITQHIAAYSVPHGEKTITFVDTPGHQAFTKMRARGATVTDIVVLVIAADDGIMPTTKEAISHAKAAGVEIIIAINKVDLPNANVEQVKQQLQGVDLAPEDWGGQTICVEVSAKQRTGLDTLLEMILLQAEVLELRADPKGTVRASVIEARMEPGKGATASVIVQSGTLKTGMPFICGDYWGKVKSILDDRGNPIKEAALAAPVEILGFSGTPTVGDELVQMDSERKAKKLSEERTDATRLGKLEKPVHS
ncbi:MAG: translation initiation factor IF-2, partial [Verrucomicrobiota bacterium]